MSLATGPHHHPSERDNKAAAALSECGLMMCAITLEEDAIKSEESTFESSSTAKLETSLIAVPSETMLAVESENSSVHVHETRLAVPCAQTSDGTLLNNGRGWPRKKRSLEISSEIYDRWCAVGVTEGVRSDSDIASFLVKVYEHVRGAPHLNVTCADCNLPLRYVCTKCCSDCHKPEDATFSHSFVHSSTDAIEPLVHADTGPANSPGVDMHKRVKSENVDVSGTELSSFTVQLDGNLNTFSAISEGGDGSGDTVNDCMLDADTEAVSSERTTPSAENTEEESGPLNSRNRKRKSESQCSKSKDDTSVAKQKKMFEPKKKLERSPKQPRPAKHVCEHCGRSFISPGALVDHMLLHTGEKPHACQICNTSFRVKRQLRLHEQAKHSGQHPCLCPFCGKAYSREGSLKVHLRKHTDKKSFICNVCNAAFLIKYQLEIHKRIHTDLRPYPCTECGFAFREKSKLKQHMMAHTGEKPFQCSQCSAAFRRKKNLILHERRHNQEKPFRCEVCNYTCVDAPLLKIHSRVHTGEKNYVCSVCDAVFAYNRGLKSHMKCHNTQRSRSQGIGKSKIKK